jgi:hypothetical protein
MLLRPPAGTAGYNCDFGRAHLCNQARRDRRRQLRATYKSCRQSCAIPTDGRAGSKIGAADCQGQSPASQQRTLRRNGRKDRSEIVTRPVTDVSDWARLLKGFGSGSEDLTRVVLVKVPATTGITVTDTVPLPAVFICPKSQRTTCSTALVP